eukprot:1902978-Alexandrium_andersonii.AAC.1
MQVFHHRDVVAREKEFAALMASDIFASASALAEDEFVLASRRQSCRRGVRVPAGQSQWQAVEDAVVPLMGNRWSENDLPRIYNFVTSTEASRLEYPRAPPRE